MYDFMSTPFCEYCHKRGHCPADGKTCYAYHRPNHFASVCQAEKKEVIHQAVDQEGASDEQAFFIGANYVKGATNAQRIYGT